MTTIIRRKRTSRLQIGPYKSHELLTGRIVYPVQGYSGYGDGVGTDLVAFLSAEMRVDWAANREELMASGNPARRGRRFSGRATVAVRARQRRHAAMGGRASRLGTAAERAFLRPICCGR